MYAFSETAASSSAESPSGESLQTIGVPATPILDTYSTETPVDEPNAEDKVDSTIFPISVFSVSLTVEPSGVGNAK